MTATSDLIDRLVSTGLTDWMVTSSEVGQALAALRSDPAIDATITVLERNGNLKKLFGAAGGRAYREVIAVVASRTTSSSSLGRRALQQSLAEAARSSGGAPGYTTFNGFNVIEFYNLCSDLGAAARKHGFAQRIGTAAAGIGRPSNPAAPFSGVGATGTNPTDLSIGLRDQAALAVGHQATVARYSNPIPGSLGAYLRGLTPAQRVSQARTLTRQKMSTVFPAVYNNDPPLRSRVIYAAGRLHNLEPELVAAFILAEQRDQSRNEDAKDYVGATSVMQGNTSIGLGQVVVSTARNNDLFQDLLPKVMRGALSHNQIATLLASDEFNIFATARYIRQVANQASAIPISRLPNTQAAFPAINMAAYARHSRHWPLDNVRALASEYTSRAWDDRLSTGWAWFVEQGFTTIKNNSLVFP